MKRMFILLLIFIPLLALSAGEAEALEVLFTRGPEALTYTRQFTQAASPEVLNQILQSIVAQVGSFKAVEGTSNPYTLRFEGGEVTVYMVLDAQNRVAGLQFTQIVSSRTTLESAAEKIKQLGKRSSILVRKNGGTLYAYNDSKFAYC